MAEVPKATKGTGGNRYQSALTREIDTTVEFSKPEWAPPENIIPEFIDEEPDTSDWDEILVDEPVKEEPKTKAEVRRKC